MFRCAIKTFFIISVAVMFVGCSTAQSAKTDSKQQPGDKVLHEARKRVAVAMSKKNAVVLFFYSSSVKDSKKDLPKIKEIATAAGAEVVEIEAMDVDALRDSYSVEYVPTVYAIRRDSGIVARWMVDLPQKEIAAALSKDLKPAPEQASIGKAITGKKPQLLFFMADWCGYCRKLAPQVEQFKKDFSGKVEVVTMNIDKLPYRMKEGYMINGVPAIFIADENGLIVQRTGFPDGYNSYVNYFKSIGVDLKKRS